MLRIGRRLRSAGIDHGPKPRDASYAYTILPGTTPAQTAAYAAKAPVRILANTSTIQAVRHEGLGLTGLVFHAAGSVAGVSADRPCVILVHTDAEGTRLSLADPAQRTEPVRVTLTGSGTPIVFRPQAGKTQTRAARR